MAEKTTWNVVLDDRPDFAAAILNSMGPIFSVPIYLVTILLLQYRYAFFDRPWAKGLLSIALAGGFCALLIVKLLCRLWGQVLRNNLPYWTPTVAHLDNDGDVCVGLRWLYRHKKLLLKNDEGRLASHEFDE
ncbi:uncharacterized protein A1O5_09512 [Cladophialophora psammophila CBS 110553]|uniref:Uncharacterized protein n=1 Tax=Cladophialophora psammophila CBS 110553 TaxID=1182543 RepID=W9XAN1_9EURO|nr:uncharacterized protein A1O5_09512 [Cladophialophora psammophila CBS 110553]EXJ67499.1 hypothetical protein A1O5_09512 [Cladophialophora psammophila CBS 110553]